MTEQIISPGVFTRENDQSPITQGPIQAGAAIIGPAVKGPIEIPTLVTSYSQFSNIFGEVIQSGSNYYTYLTNLSVKNYFSQGGETMLVTRVVSGSTSAWSAASANVYSLLNSSSASFSIETLSKGTIMNSTGSEISGALGSGSKDNVRWEVANTDTGSGTFTLLVRRGDDNTRSKTILETWTNLSLDPLSPNFISRVIGDQSKTVVQDGTTGKYYVQLSGSFVNQSSYIRVSGISLLTPNYFDNNGLPKNQFTSSLPVVSSGSFSGGTGTNIATRTMKFYSNIDSTDAQGVAGADYTVALNILTNKDEYSFNLLTIPGIIYANSPSTLDTAVDTCTNRGDAFLILDLTNYGSTIGNTTQKASSIDSNYAGAYWPWLQMLESNTNQLVWVPASVAMIGVLAFNDKISASWFAPAGMTRGGISGVIQAERKLSPTDRDSLYSGKVNPIASFPGQGIVAYGQKTLQTKASALDRINVRRLLIELKGYIGQVAKTLVFEQNTLVTRNKFLSSVTPYLESVQQRQGLYAFKVIMDDSNNTPDVIDRNQLVGQIFLQPAKTAEFIILDFNVMPTSTTFSS